MEQENKINPEWEHYYQTLEKIRKLGFTNMWGAAPYLARFESIDEKLATKVLLNWIHNYDALNKQYNWQ